MGVHAAGRPEAGGRRGEEGIKGMQTAVPRGLARRSGWVAVPPPRWAPRCREMPVGGQGRAGEHQLGVPVDWGGRSEAGTPPTLMPQ